MSEGKTLRDVAAARDLFWNNVMREMLTSLSVEFLRLDPEKPGKDAELFDGRLAVLTRAGERIPIAEVHPLFACGVDSAPGQRELSIAVECTVFQIRTPTGEVFTLPLAEIRGFHALSEELINRLEAMSSRGGEEEEGEGGKPFGFAAFTSLSKEADEAGGRGAKPG